MVARLAVAVKPGGLAMVMPVAATWVVAPRRMCRCSMVTLRPRVPEAWESTMGMNQSQFHSHMMASNRISSAMMTRPVMVKFLDGARPATCCDIPVVHLCYDILEIGPACG